MSGLDGEGVVNRTFVGIEGEPAGVLGLAAGKPLTAQDLAPIPRDANLAFAGRLDLARLMDTVLTITEKIEPQAAREVERNLNGMKVQLGVDLRKDVIDSLGDMWCAYNSSDEGGLIVTGLTAVGQVKDYERLSAAHAKLLAAANGVDHCLPCRSAPESYKVTYGCGGSSRPCIPYFCILACSVGRGSPNSRAACVWLPCDRRKASTIRSRLDLLQQFLAGMVSSHTRSDALGSD